MAACSLLFFKMMMMITILMMMMMMMKNNKSSSYALTTMVMKWVIKVRSIPLAMVHHDHLILPAEETRRTLITDLRKKFREVTKSQQSIAK